MYYLLKDNLGSTTDIVNPDGSLSRTRYTAWGDVLSSTGTLPTDKQYTGQAKSSNSGLVFYQSRWYDPSSARFIQPDSIIPNITNPLDLDRYAYVHNSPVTYNDPTGHCEIFCLATIIVASAIAAIIIPWVSSDTPNVNAIKSETPEQFSTDVNQRTNLSFNIFVTGVTVGGALFELDPGTTQSEETLALPNGGDGNPRTGEITSAPLQKDTIAYRVWGGKTSQQGSWLTPDLPVNQAEAQAKLALPSGNSLEYVTEVTIPANTQVQVSIANSLNGQPGGGIQYELLSRIPDSAWGRTWKLPD